MNEVEKKLQELGYGQSTKAIMIPLSILRTWTDAELLQLKNADVNLIITPKIEKYLKERFSSLGMRLSQINKLFENDDEAEI